MDLRKLSALQMDALRETGNIGAGHAATALSQLTDHRIEIDIPTLEIVEVGEVPSVLGGPETLAGAVYTRLLGDLSGGMLFVAPRASSLALVDLMRSRPIGVAKSFGAEEEAIVTHVSQILVSAYLAAVGRLADLSVLPSKPSFALDMVGAILESVTTEVGLTAQTAMLQRTRFFSMEEMVDAYLFFMPNPDGLEVLLARLGVG